MAEVQTTDPEKAGRAWVLPVGMAVLGLIVGFVIGVAVPIGGADSATDDSESSDSRSSSVADTEEEEVYSPTVEDFNIDLRVKEKQCFGSAGCNVTVGVDPSYVGTNVNLGDDPWEITYEISGDESGPVVQTMTLEDGSINFRNEVELSTASSSQKIKAKVTRVDPGY